MNEHIGYPPSRDFANDYQAKTMKTKKMMSFTKIFFLFVMVILLSFCKRPDKVEKTSKNIFPADSVKYLKKISPEVVNGKLHEDCDCLLNQLYDEPCYEREIQDKDIEQYRFTYNDTRDSSYIVRIIKKKDAILLISKRIPSFEYNLVYYIVENKSKKVRYNALSKFLTMGTWDSLQNSIKKYNFWDRKQEKLIDYQDGTYWSIEGYRNGKYKSVTIATPEADIAKNREYLLLGTFFLHKADIIKGAHFDFDSH